MTITRRQLLQAGAVSLVSARTGWLEAVAFARARGVLLKIGVPDWSLKQELKLDAIPLAKRIGFDGVQVSLGVADDKLPLSDPSLQQAYLTAARRERLPIASVCLNILHRNILKSDALAERWVADAIPIARALGVRVILLPFFGKGALTTQAEMDYVGDRLRELAPAAERANVILGLEDTISARDNVRIMERAKSPAVLVYYDVGNSTGNGFKVVDEIRWLGHDRICEVHLKDNPHFLGQGSIDFPAVIDALADIGVTGWAQLETTSPTNDIEADMATNLKYIRRLIAQRNAS